MPKGLLYSTDGGATFNTVSVDVADYTQGGIGGVSNEFYSAKDSQNNAYIFCGITSAGATKGKLIKITSAGIKSVATLNWNYSMYVPTAHKPTFAISRDEQYIICNLHSDGGYNVGRMLFIPTNFNNNEMLNCPSNSSIATADGSKFAIYKDQYIWVASGTTVKIYDYTTKAELASIAVSSYNTLFGLSCDINGYLYTVFKGINGYNGIDKFVFNGVDTITRTQLVNNSTSGLTWIGKQLLVDRFGDLIILTNTGTASTLLKYSNTGTLIDTVSLSVGTNKGAYGLQVYSKDNGTKCWVQFGNDLGTWKTAETTAQGQVFGAVSKLSTISTGELTYGDDNGGENNYSVWCP